MKQNTYTSTRWLGLVFVLCLAPWSGLQAQVQSMPYFEDFESFSTCTGTCNVACVLTNGWLNATDDSGSDWTVDVGGTSSSLTGPSVDHNPGTSAGKYLYFETSSPCFGGDDSAHLVSPPLDLAVANGYGISYWYHMYGQSMGDLHVDLSTDGGATWILDITPAVSGDQGDVWLYNEVSLVPWQGDTVQIRWRGVSGSNFYSDMAIDDIGSYAIVPLDAGVSAIPNPTSPAIPGMNAVEAVVSNFGTDTLVSAAVNWTLNGVAQPTLSWAGTVLPGGATAPLSLGMGNFAVGFNTVRAWTTAPNGGVDQENSNDTLEVSILACNSIAGTYTLGGPGADYASFSDAAFALMNCGISGPVTINVTPGTYLGDRLELGEVAGASATNTITFDGGTASGTILEWDGSAGIPTVYLKGADYITLQNLTIRNTGTTDAWGIRLADTASFNVVDHCIIEMDAAGTGDVDAVSASAEPLTGGSNEGLNARHCTFSNNTITGGDKGFHFEGNVSFPYSMTGIEFLNNTIVNVNLYGFFLDNMDSLLIADNVVAGTRNAGGDGIYTNDIQNYTITGNNMVVSDWPIYIFDGNDDYQVSNPSLIANNMFSSVTDHGGRFDDFVNTNLYHNTFYSGASTGTYFNDLDSVEMINNIFYSPTVDAIEFLDETSTIVGLVFDYNLIYSAGGGNMIDDGPTFYPDLASWQAANLAINVNSVSGDPVFVASDDLHLLGSAANDVGNNGLGITVDIDGDARPQAPSTTVDIGADEYTPLANNAAPIAILSPPNGACGDNVQPVEVVFFNGGANAITTLPINATVSGDITASLNFTYNGNLAAFAYDTVVIGTINTFNGGTFDISLSTSLAGDQDTTDDVLATQSFFAYPEVPSAMADTVIVCDADTATLMAAIVGASNYAWYDSLVGGTKLATGPAFTNPSIAGQSTYYLAYDSFGDSLSAGFAGGNGQSGNMFDLTALGGSIRVDSLDLHIGSTTTETVEVYYTSAPGGFTANAANAAAWTLVGTQVVTGAGIGNPTRLNGIPSFTVPAGQTYGVYVTLTTSTNIDYSNGNPGDFVADNNVRIDFGFGMSYPFGGLFSVRSFNGNVYYSSPACSDTRVPVTALSDTLVSASFTSSATELAATFADLSTGGPLSWAWDFGDGTTDTVASPVHTYAAPGTYTVSLIVTDFCGADTLSQTLTVSCAAPATAFGSAANDLEISFSDSTVTGGNSAASYLWDFGDGTTDTTASPVYTYAAPGTYTVCLTVSDICGADSSCQTLIVTCAPPSAGFETSITEDTLSFFNASTGTGTLSYLWDFGDGTSDTTANPTHVYASSGMYTACLTVTDVCGADTSCQMITFIKTGIDELQYFSRLQVYPNPTTGQFVLEAEISQPVGLNIKLYDRLGKVVYRKEEGRVAGFYSQAFDLSALPSGIYLLTLESEGNSTTIKVEKR